MRARVAAGICCEVAAPSKLQRPAGDRVKIDIRDARHLARLLHLVQGVTVAVPDAQTEAAGVLVRVLEDVRGDLAAARHRLSKLLPREGIVYAGGKAWTWAYDTWLRAERLDPRVLQLAFDTSYETMLAAVDRRDRLDTAIATMAADSPVHPGRDPPGLPARGLDPDRVRLDGRDRGLAPADRTPDRGPPRPGPNPVLLGRLTVPKRDRLDRQRPHTPTAGRGRRANRRLHARWARFDARGKRPVVANTAIARKLAGCCW
jgi:hypothetical protein